MSSVELPAKLVSRILIRCGGEHDAALKIMQRLTEIRRNKHERAEKIRKIREDADAAINALKTQCDCKHEFCESHGDPSGNGDSEEECLICGEWIGRKSVRFT